MSNRPVRMVLGGDKELAATHAGDAKNVMVQLENISRTNPAIKTISRQLNDGTTISITADVGGIDIVKINSGKEVRYSEWVLVEEYLSKSLVAIIPCVSVETSDEWGDIATVGMVCFDISEDGWGEICDWTDEINYESNDPVAPYTGQETNRKEWYDKKSSSSYSTDTEKTEYEKKIVRIKRVDGGIYAYDGDPIDYEYNGSEGLFATAIESGSDYVDYNDSGEPPVTYEDSVRPTLSIDPGPIPGDDWTWFEIDGGSSYGEESLFYSGWSGGEPPAAGSLVEWWPPEFNQKISYQYKFYRNGFCFIMTGDWGDDNTPNSYLFHSFKREIVQYSDYRSWINFPADGHSEGVYGLIYNTTDTVSNTFPYTTITPILRETDIGDSEIEPYDYGIYIYNNYNYFIIAANRGSLCYSHTGWNTSERFPVNPSRIGTEFNERQTELAKGNSEESYTPPFGELSYWTGLYSTGYQIYNYSNYDKGVYCENKYYNIVTPDYISEEDENNGYITFRSDDKYTPKDFGIFIKGEYEKPGDDIDSKKLVYAYTMIQYDESGEYIKILYGVLFNGDTGDRTHIMSDWYDTKRVGKYSFQAGAIFPDFEGKSKIGNKLYGDYKITIGEKTTKTKKYKRYIINE